MVVVESESLLDVEVTPEMAREHGLSVEEYRRIGELLGREPNVVEMAVFGVMWSEHCSYKNSKKLLRMFPTQKKGNGVGEVLVKAGEENAGVIDIGEGWAICFKIESHNHPSAIEPFEGAATGVGGILRDIFTMGARPVLLTNSLRFGDLRSVKARRLLRGVVAGIAHYGNCIGVPNVGGDVYFDRCYEGNPLVNALCLGVLRHDEIKRGAASGVGNPVYYVGAPTGRDGLGGASFASKALSEASNEDRPAVQKGDPFMEKLLMEACLEMMAVEGLVVGIQDMGAAGLTCSIAETAARGGTGIEVDLGKVPAREVGMNAYDFLLSESQERMLVIVEKGREAELEAIFSKWDLHSAKIGEVVEGDRMKVWHGGECVVDIPARVLADEAPEYSREAREPEYIAWGKEVLGAKDIELKDVEGVLNGLLMDPVIASKRWIWRQYDHMVGASTVVEPGSDAGVVRIRMGGGKERFVAIANDCNNTYCFLDPYRGGQIAVLECLRNLACSGAVPLGMTNNLNFGNPEKPESYYMLQEAVKGLAEACEYFDLPVVGGNVSLYNESEHGVIDPTPVVSIAGLIEEEAHITKQWVTAEGQCLLLVGGFATEVGGSRYWRSKGIKSGPVPEVDLGKEAQVHGFVLSQIREGRVVGAHDVSDGGLLVALVEMLFAEGGTFGAQVLVDGERLDEVLFGESQGRVLLAVEPEDVDRVMESRSGLDVVPLGRVTSGSALCVGFGGCEVSMDLNSKRDIWESVLSDIMNI